MRTPIILIKLGLGLCLPGFAQNNFLETPDSSLTETNAIKDYVSKPAEIPTLTIKSGDVVQESIECQRDTTQEDLRTILPLPQFPNYPTNAFRVRWRYTDEAAKQTLAFREKHRGETVRKVIGSFSMAYETFRSEQLSKLFASEDRKSRWLAKPVDGVYGLTEEQAKQMVADLKSK